MKNVISLFVLLLAVLPCRASTDVGNNRAEETLTLHFNYADITCDTIVAEDEHIYQTLSYPNCYNMPDVGNPTLPVKYIQMSIPNNAENIEVEASPIDVTSHTLTWKLYPVQPEETTSLPYVRDFTPCNNSVYNSATGYPTKLAEIMEISCAGQGNKIVRVAVYPIVYYPQENRYDIYENIVLKVSYSTDLRSRLVTGNTRSCRDIGLPYYEYCVITSSNLKDSFSRLIAWRHQQGLNAGVVCIEDILDNSYLVGDTVSSIYDDAGKVRQYLQYAYQNGTKSVLFGGDDSVLPIRYGWDMRGIPSDLYFSELNSNWNTNGNDHYGEQGENTDYGAELSVGRILCVSGDDVANYTDKLLRYELYPGNGDFSYLRKALYTQDDQMQGGNEADLVASQLHNIFPNDSIMSEYPSYYDQNPTYPYGHDVINAMKEHYGFVSWFGHGHPNAITTKSRGINNAPHYGIFTVEGDSLFIMHETGNGLNTLNNKFFPMIAYSIACTITPFDIYTDQWGVTYDEFPNIGYTFTLGKDFGGPALIGNTREGYVGSSCLLQKQFSQYINDYTLGEAQNLAKQYYNYTLKHYLAHTSNLIGCPNIRMWTDTPALFNATLSYNSSNAVINANTSIDSAQVCIRNVCGPTDDASVVLCNPSQGAICIANAENKLLTFIGKNCLPQILPLNIKDTRMRGTHKFFVTDMTCGVKDDYREVEFSSDAIYDIEFSGTVILNAGVEIREGAEISIKPSYINY